MVIIRELTPGSLFIYYLFMSVGQHYPVSAAFSVTQKSEVVKILEVYNHGDHYKVQYANGYTEILPVFAFIIN